MCLYIFISIYVLHLQEFMCHMHTGASESQKRASDSQELKLQEVVNCPICKSIECFNH